MTKKIGIDLDNTIINYSIPINFFSKKILKKNKTSKKKIKEYLIKNFGEHKWTEAQEEIYGNLILKAKLFNYCKHCLKFLFEQRFDIYIISHKTRKSQFSSKYDLRKIARIWIKKNLNGLIKKKNIYFCDTINEKIRLINKNKFNYFIDDLPKILLHKKIEKKSIKILFSNEQNKKLKSINNWKKILLYLKRHAKNK
mgnify:CR=1 FL=1|tara:strand:+ start:3355 stop:3945 length:591 start_codon:yes stop_codon:yes gene_type:complete